MLTRLRQAGAFALVPPHPSLWLFRLAVVLAFTAFMARAAMAEVVDVTPGVTYALDLAEAVFGVAILAAGFLLERLLSPWIGERNAKSLVDKLERAGVRAARSLRLRFLNRTWSVEVENEYVAMVAAYLGRRFPDAAKAFGLTPNGLRDFAAALLGEYLDGLDPSARPAGYEGMLTIEDPGEEYLGKAGLT